jgi:hypothetical protein
MTAASGTAIARANPEPGAARTASPLPAPPQPLSPAGPNYRLTAVRVKDALRAPATPARPSARSLTRPPARAHRQPPGKAEPAGQLPHAREKQPHAKHQVIPHLTPARFFRDDTNVHKPATKRSLSVNSAPMCSTKVQQTVPAPRHLIDPSQRWTSVNSSTNLSATSSHRDDHRPGLPTMSTRPSRLRCSVSVPPEPGKQRKTAISVQWSAARSGVPSRTQSLMAGSHGRHHADLRRQHRERVR